MAIFNSYVKLPEGSMHIFCSFLRDFQRSQDSAPEMLQAVKERWQRRSPQAPGVPTNKFEKWQCVKTLVPSEPQNSW